MEMEQLPPALIRCDAVSIEGDGAQDATSSSITPDCYYYYQQAKLNEHR